MNSQTRQTLWIGLGRQVAVAAPLWALWACGAPIPYEPALVREDEPALVDGEESALAGQDEPAAPSSGGLQSSGELSPAPSGGGGTSGGAEAALAPSSADFEELADQTDRPCGAALDRCAATAGCETILACAKEHDCTGAACYCADARCESPGPCRSVIDSAPGAVSGTAAGRSRGPAADAAAAVGVCVAQLLDEPSSASGAD